ncbi:hypothetical protein ACFFU2_04755 [Halomonas alkalicola]|uniref:Uncharacterized protein n=1 Tax=Halomonas alkalicola TaxID=1930622 RepID=A0ABY9H2Y8_9GAMM|nr:hypothetical protein [Halomonas alkalicola]WLI72521.1 hypothetical protein B6N23_12165 [Halomonas alkalicola]
MTSDSQARYPDIEIYLARPSVEAIGEWLIAAIGAAPLSPAGKGKWRTRGQHDGEEVPVLLVEKAADGFASLWFDSPHTPWESDAACARAAAAQVGCEVRCSLGGWHPGDDPDRFLKVLPDGSESEIDWPDSGH